MPATTDKREKAREVVDILEEISVLLVRKGAQRDVKVADLILNNAPEYPIG